MSKKTLESAAAKGTSLTHPMIMVQQDAFRMLIETIKEMYVVVTSFLTKIYMKVSLSRHGIILNL